MYIKLDECDEYYRRVCLYSAPKTKTAFQLWHANDSPSVSSNPVNSNLNNYKNETPYDSKMALSLPSSSSSSFSSRSATYMTTNGMVHVHKNQINHRPVSPEISGRHLSTGISLLDYHLRGGIRIGTITELFGKAGTGKTQIAFQMAIREATKHEPTLHCTTIHHTNLSSVEQHYPPTSGSTIYIDTEQKVSLSRLREMVIARQQQKHTEYVANSMNHHNDTTIIQDQLHEVAVNAVLKNFMVHTPRNMNELLSVLNFLEEEISNHNWKCTTRTSKDGDRIISNHNDCLPVRLIVLDSIAAPTRHDFSISSSENDNHPSISKPPLTATIVLQIAQKLKQLATQFNVAILVINQCTNTSTTGLTTTESINPNYNSSSSSAALGTSWHHCVSTRIQSEHMTQSNHHSSIECRQNTIMRQENQEYMIRVLKSNVVGPSNAIGFRIESNGVIGKS
jgi:RecA/RadA recombinase